MTIVWFGEDADAGAIGHKAYSLSRLSKALLPVPQGYCITVEGLTALPRIEIEAALSKLGSKTVAVRSSAVGEDSIDASYAGIYATRVNVAGIESVLQALREVRESASAAAANAYRL